MPELVTPDTRFFSSFQEAAAEWGAEHQDGANILDGDDVSTEAGFSAWVQRLRRDATEPPVPGFVTCTNRWVVEGEQYLGAISLRHELNAFLAERGGHIGYGIRPSARRRGLASFALREILPIASSHGLERVLLTCGEDNEGSWRTIESVGGVLENVATDEDGARYRRYWIDL